MEKIEVMSENEKLQRAVSYAISYGYQLDREAFEFLHLISKTGDPERIVEAAVKKFESQQEKPLFINRLFLEEIIKETVPATKEEAPVSSSTLQESKRAFCPYAKNVPTNLRVLMDSTDKVCTNGSIEDYLSYFRDRFKRLQRLLKQRIDLRDAISISEARRSAANSRVKVVGMIMEKREANQRIILRIEDLEAAITVIMPRNASPELMEKARALLLDQVVCVQLIKGRNDLFIAEDFILPETPQKVPNKCAEPVYAVLTSDLHVGSKLFMKECFNRFLLWLNGKYGDSRLKEIASHVKYVIIAGDIVDGIGVYPRQVKELAVKDVDKQYQLAAELIEQIPDYIELIIIPGNHDAARKALPQPALPERYVELLCKTRKVYSFSDPCIISLHGVELLLYHGRSLDDVFASIPNMRATAPAKAMEFLLRSRHLAPIYGQRTPIAPETQDLLVIERIPDIFHAGHVHVLQYSNYRGTLIVNSGAWQLQTDYQKKMGLEPTPGIVPVVNLQTLEVTPISFT
ncbi:MAG: DNA-directed DNA polymerase II small subunit [Candidatus Bathyarchaeia archaeon]